MVDDGRGARRLCSWGKSSFGGQTSPGPNGVELMPGWLARRRCGKSLAHRLQKTAVMIRDPVHGIWSKKTVLWGGTLAPIIGAPRLDGGRLTFLPGLPERDLPGDAFASGWGWWVLPAWRAGEEGGELGGVGFGVVHLARDGARPVFPRGISCLLPALARGCSGPETFTISGSNGGWNTAIPTKAIFG
jgi:hypothetical protein